MTENEESPGFQKNTPLEKLPVRATVRIVPQKQTADGGKPHRQGCKGRV